MRLPDLATRGHVGCRPGPRHARPARASGPGRRRARSSDQPTSIGDVHHGALLLLPPGPVPRPLTGGDSPLAVTCADRACSGSPPWASRGGWRARSAGRSAGIVARAPDGGLGRPRSTSRRFIWNPNLIALTSAIAPRRCLAGLVDRAGPLVAPGGGRDARSRCSATSLGVTLLPVIGALFVADARRHAPGDERGAVVRAGLAGLAIVALVYVPLVVHELTTDFAEVPRPWSTCRAGGEVCGPPARDAPPGRGHPRRVVAADRADHRLARGGRGVLRRRRQDRRLAMAGADPAERTAVRWLGLGLLWSGRLPDAWPRRASRSSIPGLPNDHYHAFADRWSSSWSGSASPAAWRTWRQAARGRTCRRRGRLRRDGHRDGSPSWAGTCAHAAGRPEPGRRLPAAAQARGRSGRAHARAERWAIRSPAAFKPARRRYVLPAAPATASGSSRSRDRDRS